MSRFTTAALVVPTLVLTVAASSPFPDSVPLPNDFSPEGIAVGTGSTFYVGSLVDGDIYGGDLRSGQGAVFIDAPPGREAGGLKVDEPHHRLFVAGGITGHGYVYDTRNGAPLEDVQFGPAGTVFINDVVVTKGGAYFTDSVNPVLYKIPIAPDGTLGPPNTITLSGPASATPGVFNLNGIDATPDGDTLVVAHSSLGALFAVDPRSGASRRIELTGGSLVPGTPDGILLDGTTVWVVENFANEVAEVRLSPDLSSGLITSVLTNADVAGRFQIPTTVAEHGNRLAIVNARFDLGLPPPLGTGVPPGTTYDVVLVNKPGPA
jgi:sugar lactone lactonase YvrE